MNPGKIGIDRLMFSVYGSPFTDKRMALVARMDAVILLWPIKTGRQLL
jgi:hypothetical protein